MLIRCAECSHKVSTTAVSCPKCGAALTSEAVARGVARANRAGSWLGLAVWLAMGYTWLTERSTLAGVLFWGVLAVAVAILAAVMWSGRTKRAPEEPSGPSPHTASPASQTKRVTLSSVLARLNAGESLSEAESALAVPILEQAARLRPKLTSRQKTFLKELEKSIQVMVASGRPLTDVHAEFQRARRVRGGKQVIRMGVIVAGVTVTAWWLFLGDKSEINGGRKPADTVPSVGTTETNLAWISIEGRKVSHGLTADEVFETLKPVRPRRTQTVPDAKRAGSLVVTHTYVANGREIELRFARIEDTGPYRLVDISARSYDVKTAEPFRDPEAASTINTMEEDPRLQFAIEVIAFDAATGFDSGTADRMTLKITNGSQVMLPYLTIRTDRWARGENVGWSRRPSIDVSDLAPGYSKIIDYYPKGHLSAYTLGPLVIDRMTAGVERYIEREDRRFFPELPAAEKVMRQAITTGNEAVSHDDKSEDKAVDQPSRDSGEAKNAVEQQLSESESADKKEAAWRSYFTPADYCDNPPTMKAMVECGNAHIRAKREFEIKWERGDFH